MEETPYNCISVPLLRAYAFQAGGDTMQKSVSVGTLQNTQADKPGLPSRWKRRKEKRLENNPGKDATTWGSGEIL